MKITNYILAAFDKGAKDKSNSNYANPFSKLTEPLQWRAYELGYHKSL